jgi:DNA-binding transcriptional ArsR family regulator
MPVTRLKTRRDAKEYAGLEALRDVLLDMAGTGAPSEVVGQLVTVVERRLAAGRGWKFVMVEPALYANVVAYLTRHSYRPLKAVELFTRLFAVLPPDGNEVQASRAELARMVGIEPRTVSELMAELEAIGAVYRRREGRGVRYFVNPVLGTHLTGAVRDRAQAGAPALRLVQPAE